MIFIRHHEDCAGKPKPNGKLAGVCDCKVAPLDTAAYERLKIWLGELAAASLKSGEDNKYFALRLDMLADVIASNVSACKATTKRPDRNARELRERHRKTLAAEVAAPTGARRVKLTRDEREAKRKREAELFAELTNEHGYTISDMRKIDERIVFTATKNSVTTLRAMRLMVPEDSELARTLDKLAKAVDAAKAKGVATTGARKEPKRRPSRAKRSSLSPAEKADRDSRWGGASRR